MVHDDHFIATCGIFRVVCRALVDCQSNVRQDPTPPHSDADIAGQRKVPPSASQSIISWARMRPPLCHLLGFLGRVPSSRLHLVRVSRPRAYAIMRGRDGRGALPAASLLSKEIGRVRCGTRVGCDRGRGGILRLNIGRRASFT